MDFGYILLPIFLFVALVVLVATMMIRRQTAGREMRRGLFLASLLTFVLFFLACGNFVRVNREEALVFAAWSGDAAVVRRELARGTNPESFFEGTTALEAAQKGGYEEIVQLLKDAGARR